MGAEEVIAIGESRRVNCEDLAVEGCAGGRRLLVAMKLNTSCREMLTWTIAKLAQPGDHILALHVSSQPGTTVEEEDPHAQQLANTLRGVLSVYESLCNLKQIKLQLEIVSGHKVKHVLVEVASSYEACKLILGTNRSFSVGRTKALGRYCLNRLPCTCTVVILEQGEIVFDKRGRLGADMTRLDMIQVFRRSMRLGRHRNPKSSRVEEEPDTTATTTNSNNYKKPSHGRQRSMSEIPDSSTLSITTTTPELSFGSCSSIIQEDFTQSPVTVLSRASTAGFEALRISFSKRRAQGSLKPTSQRSDTYLDEETQEYTTSKTKNLPGTEFNNENSKVEDVIVPGWPLLNHAIELEKPVAIRKKKLPGTRAECTLSPSPSPSPTPSPQECWIREQLAEPTSRVRNWGFPPSPNVAGLCSHRRSCTAFAYKALEAATSGFSQENVVGRGGGSEVFRGSLRDGRVVAVKRLNPGPQAEEELLVDIEINTTLSHAHVVSLLGYCVEASHMLLVYDYLPEGNLEDHLHARGKDATILPWEVRYKVAVGIAKALVYLHDGCPKPVVHRDVKTSNILLTTNFESQLSDFGLALWAPTKTSHLLCNDVVGTFGYLAPEYFMLGRVNAKTDVYAFGVVLLELITGRKPIDTTRPKGEQNLVNWARPLLVERALTRLVDPLLRGVYDIAQTNHMMIAALLAIQQSAQQRPQMTQILQVLSGDRDKSPSPCMSSWDAMSESDLEEFDAANYGVDDTHLRGHLALALVGVDDDSTSQCSVVDIPHANKYLEDYLEGRYSRSTSFED